MSVVFDIVIAFVVLVIAVVVIKYALILGAAVLAVLWNGVVILLRNRWITAFFLWEALSLFPPCFSHVPAPFDKFHPAGVFSPASNPPFASSFFSSARAGSIQKLTSSTNTVKKARRFLIVYPTLRLQSISR